MIRKKNKSPEEKIASVLGGKSIYDICQLGGFRSNLEAYVKVQREDREIAREMEERQGGGKGRKYHLPAHPIDKTIEWPMEQWEEEAIKCFYKVSALPATVREYVYQLGKQAYNLTCANLVINEYPEMRNYFFKNSKVV